MSTLGVIVLLAVLAWAMLWVFLGRSAWWIPAFAFSFLGGYVNVGFKLYPLEIGLGLSLAAVTSVVISHPRRLANRPRLDWSLYLLVAYMLAHLAVSCYLAAAAESPGTGTIVRQYANGLWAPVFAGLFWAYGDLRHFRSALVLATAGCVVRILLGLAALHRPDTAQSAAFFFPATDPVPGTDLRFSGPALMALLTVWFYQLAARRARMLIGLAYVAAAWLTLLGASRVAGLSVFVVAAMWAIVQRNRRGLLVEGVAVAVLLGAVNLDGHLHLRLPEGVRRSLSTFVVVHAAAGAPGDTPSSNSWHFRLLKSGERRWTATPETIIFGNKVEGWHPDYARLTSIESMADVAARISAYENAFFTVTATLGLVGLLLFIRVVYWLYRPLMRGILQNGVRSDGDALALIAVQSLVVYVGFCWIAGGYPSSPIVWGSLAAVSWCDRRTPVTLGRAGPDRRPGGGDNAPRRLSASSIMRAIPGICVQ